MPKLWQQQDSFFGLASRIVWINVPYQPGHNFRALLPNEWIVADYGYTEGLNFVIYKGVGPDWYQTMTE
jgi:hypothetical protein